MTMQPPIVTNLFIVTAAKTVTAYNAAKNGCHSNYPDDNGRPDQPESQKAKTDAGKKRINRKSHRPIQ